MGRARAGGLDVLDAQPPGTLGPQPGPQTAFLSTPADIAIYGGAAGGGKTWALLMEPLRHTHRRDFGAVFFRRTSVQIRNEGALWDESLKLYTQLPNPPKPREYDLWWRWPSGASVTFAHLEHDKNVLDYQGSQIPLICFDELTHFSAYQFWYMVSRNRSTCGVEPYIRATCNPDCDSWVAKLIEWWIDQNTGLAIPERAGAVRWFVRVGDDLVWADDPLDLVNYVDPVENRPIPPKSLTFIPSLLSDNKALLRADPRYMANLLALPLVERERLLRGNWKIRWSGQKFFDLQNMLVNGAPIEVPKVCDAVFAVMDTAAKTGKNHDGVATTYFAVTKFGGCGYPLAVIDYDYRQLEGASLEAWLPSVQTVGEQMARDLGARQGYLGVWIEDASSGIILLQQQKNIKGSKAHAINSKLTSLGKDGRALSVSGYVSTGKVKLTRRAYDRVVVFKGEAKNHLISQVENYSIADPEEAKRADDVFDTFCYGVALALGNKGGF